MKNIFGVEWFNKQADFDEAIERLKAHLKDGDESEIVYIQDETEECHEVLVRGMFIPPSSPDKGKLVPSIWFNKQLLRFLNISIDKKEKLLLK